jgi:hypothetical protein
MAKKGNPYHVKKGSPEGGQFDHAPGGSADSVVDATRKGAGLKPKDELVLISPDKNGVIRNMPERSFMHEVYGHGPALTPERRAKFRIQNMGPKTTASMQDFKTKHPDLYDSALELYGSGQRVEEAQQGAINKDKALVAARKGAELPKEHSNMMGLPLKSSTVFSEGQEVKIIGNVDGSGKTGIIDQIAPSGKYFGVKTKSGVFLGYYSESDLKAR